MEAPANSPADRRARAHRAAAGAASARPHHDLGYRSRNLRDGLHGAEHSGRAYRPRVIRPRRLVRSCGLRGSTDPAQSDARLVFRPDHRRRSDRGGCGFRIRFPDFEAPRRVFLAADAGAGGDALCGIVSLDRSHRRRERSWRHHTTDAARLQPGILHRLLLVCSAHRIPGADSVVALSQFDRRHRAGGDPRERAARALSRLSDQSLQARRVRAVRRHYRACRHTLALPEPHDLSRSDLGVILRRFAGDGRDRRHAQLSGAGARRAVLYPVPRIPRHLHRELAVLVRPGVRRFHRVFADRPGRRRRAADRAVPQEDGRRCRDVGAPDRSAAAAGIPAA